MILAVVVLAAIGFGSMVRIGGNDGGARRRAAAVFRPVPPVLAHSSPGLLAVPVTGVARSAIEDSWGDARRDGAGAHHGTDLIAPAGTLVVAAAPGRVEKLFHSALGGITLYERSVDRHWLYYYAHLAGYASGVHEGQAVRAGDPLGFVGDTGDAGPGNFHLHFGLSRVAPEGHWWQGEDVNPFPLLAGRPSRR
ncbi:M23 family metallopeptidase [Sphingomonas bacterium]|uniref:M23 family metallopeptidase n=1 Tax=Sphingomonas bacterium TaxID=1895847 RepID=UPI0015759CD0|nr:M23 family metallopeptidase [Sphingomonas bacterium]